MGAPKGFWECENCGDYNPDYVSECPNCKKKKDGSSGSRYSASSIATRQSTSSAGSGTAASSSSRNSFNAQGATGYSNGASFMNVCAWIIWIAGGIASIGLSLTFNRYGSVNGLNFLTLIIYAFAFGLVGFTYKVLGELFQNIANIAASLQNMTITQTGYRDDPNNAKIAKDVALIADTLRAMQVKSEEHHDDKPESET